MSKVFILLAVTALALAACGGSDGANPLKAIQDAANQVPGDTLVSGGIDPGANPRSNSDGPGTMDNPTPEASGALAPNGFRIGNTVWERTVPITRGQCFVQDSEGATPFAAWGTLNGDDALEFGVSYDSDTDSTDAQVTSDNMFWVAGKKDGSQLSVEHDVEALSIAGTGLFYNLHTDEWAYGSFQFTCEPG